MVKQYIELRKINTREQAESVAKVMGFDSLNDFETKTGSSLINHWVETGKETINRPLPGKYTTITPIAVIVHNRFSSESANGFVQGEFAYISEEVYQNLF
ncbi:hypothetical protein CMI37_09380 [Candidatus Pacearchaeota archaeon]|nr:hypothetical protein [Candidatus Pacearchaeota archaeon]|tara:strand:+ start:1549 stop:1848 length:300 start_codon:yes stop_codon:yes gene_type:complete